MNKECQITTASTTPIPLDDFLRGENQLSAQGITSSVASASPEFLAYLRADSTKPKVRRGSVTSASDFYASGIPVGVVFTEDLEDAFSHLESDIVVVLDSDSLRQQSKQHIEQLRTAYMVQSLKARSIGVSTWPLVTPSRWSGSCQDLLKNSGDRFVTETRQVPSGWSVFPEAPFEVPLQNSWLSLHRKAKSLIRLNVGWDGDRAPPPQNFAVQNARRVLLALQDQALLPSKLNPTVVGGIGITIKRCDKKAYIECSNKGSVLLLLSDGESEPQVTKFEPSENRFRSLIDAARTYLHE